MFTLFPYADIEYFPDSKQMNFTIRLLSETHQQVIGVRIQLDDAVANVIENGVEQQ